MQRLGEKIRFLRKQQNLTLRELAAIIGQVSHTHLGEIEGGHNLPSLPLLVKLADFFHVSTDQLVKDELEVWEK
jgi:transcriptional regulator with XRE-family HTH domain